MDNGVNEVLLEEVVNSLDEGTLIIIESSVGETIFHTYKNELEAIENYEKIYDSLNWTYLELLLKEKDNTYRIKSESRHKVLPKRMSVQEVLSNAKDILNNWEYYRYRINGNGKYYENRRENLPFNRIKPMNLSDMLYGEYVLFVFNKNNDYGAFYGFKTQHDLDEYIYRLLSREDIKDLIILSYSSTLKENYIQFN